MALRKFQTSAEETLLRGLYLMRLPGPPCNPSNTGSTCTPQLAYIVVTAKATVADQALQVIQLQYKMHLVMLLAQQQQQTHSI